MSEAGDFIDAALRYEVSPYSFATTEADGLQRYGTSVGAIRGSVRDALRRYPAMSHDEITALSSELWVPAVFERRMAAIILFQSRVNLLLANDLTRIEGFIRTAASRALVDQLVRDVVTPLLARMDAATAARVQPVITRWAVDPNPDLSLAGRALGTAVESGATPAASP